MIVIYRNGVRTVLTGWRAWLLMLGFALTLLTLALFALPLAILLALLIQGFQSPRR